MKTLLHELKTSLLVTAVTAVVLCGLYPLAVRGGARLIFPRQAEGSLLRDADGNLCGSSLLGQNFSGTRYFHPRPSAAGTPGYNGAGSGGSNLGPTSQKLHDAVRDRVAAYRATNHLPSGAPVPADAVTASASGLDPHISLPNALLQLPRVAAARGLPEEQVRPLVDKYTNPPGLRMFGDPGVNVLQLNLALDGKWKK